MINRLRRGAMAAIATILVLVASALSGGGLSGAPASAADQPPPVYDYFNGGGNADGSATDVGGKTWQALNGAWARTGAGEVTAEIGPGANPMLVTDMGTGDVDVRVATTGSSGEAVYFRVQDATSWLRARLAHTQNFYIDREFTVAYREWEVNHYHTEKQWQDRLVKWEYSKTTYTWSAWHTYAQSSCQASAGDVSLPADTANDQYRTANPVTTGCSGGKKKWDKQSRTRSSSVDYQWIADGVTPPAGYTRTTNSQIINVGSPYWGDPHPFTGVNLPALVQSRNVLDSTGWQSNNTVTAPDVLTGQTRADPKVLWWTRGASLLSGSADPCPHWQSLGLTIVSCSLTGATRQGDVVGEATRLVLDKSVAGAVTTLSSWDVSPSLPGFRVTADGSTISVYTGSSTGTYLGAVNESAFASQGRHGCGLGGTGLLTPTYALTYCYLQALRSTPTGPTVPTGLTLSPCLNDCDPTWRFTNSLTPTLRAQSSATGTTYLTYTFQVRDWDTQAVVATGTMTGVPGTSVAWQVPGAQLANETIYETRVGASDSSTTAWSEWQPMGVDVSEAPQIPAGASLSPCAGTCSALVSTSLVPVVTATLDDPDTDLLTGNFEVRAAGTTTILASGSSGLIGGGGLASFQVPAGKLTPNGEYEFRVGGNDGAQFTWSGWSAFSVSIPTGPIEPSNLELTSCLGSCAAWLSNTTTPTFAVTRSDSTSGTTDIRFEVRSNTSTVSGTVSAVPAGGTATWTVPSGTLGNNAYLVRAATVTGAGVTWTAWRQFAVDPGAPNNVSFPSIISATAMVGFDASWQPDPSLDVDDTGPPSGYGESELQVLDAAAEQDDANAQALGYGSADEMASGKTVSTAAKYAPVSWIHEDEKHFPMSASTFVNHSELRWSHAGCSDDKLSGSPSQSKMGTGQYTDQVYQGFFPCTGKDGTVWKSTDDVRPFNDGGPEYDNEGMFLDLDDTYRDGDGFNGDEPVYFRYKPYSYIQYWFHWGDSFVNYGGAVIVAHHEGDWEHVAIQLDAHDNHPITVQYFYHHNSCTLPFRDAPRRRKHILLWVAKDSHGNYPAGSSPESIDTHTDQISGGAGSKIWYANNNLQEVTQRDWYRYAGGFGEVGESADTTGPWGPNPIREIESKPTFATHKCNM